MDTALVILAAGMGSRYGGNKQVDGIGPNGEILMEYSVFDALRAGFNKIVFIIKPDMQALMDNLLGKKLSALCDRTGRPVEIRYVYQSFESIPAFYHIPEGRVKPFGTVHALLCAEQAVREPFAVINADDYYGIDAYRTLHERLISLDETHQAMMVAYRLKNTVSRFGTVTRGLCDVQNGRLTAIRETYNIRQNEDGSVCDATEGRIVPLDAEALVSMNMWGFTPWIFPAMRRRFHDFLRALPQDELRREYVLPVFVSDMLGAGELTVRVEATDSEWFGMTYREDRPQVAEALERLHREGLYPPSLH